MNIENFTKQINDFPKNFLNELGINTKKDSDGDGTSDIFDAKPKDFNNFSPSEIKELFGADYDVYDKALDFLGIVPSDTDRDGVPNSYEIKKKLNLNNPDTDGDGIYDGEEVYKGLDPVNADQDKDGVLDGRDAYPLDSSRSVLENDKDSDSDGIGDRFEGYIGSNPFIKDTDADGLSDAVDDDLKANYRDSAKIKAETLANGNATDLKFSVQNNFLDFISSVILFLLLIMFCLFLFTFSKWWVQIRHDVDHYYHLFHNAFGFKHHDEKSESHHNTVHKEDFKTIKKDIKHENKESDVTHINHNIKKESNEPISMEGNFEPIIKELVFEIDTRWKIVTKYMNDQVSDLWRLGIIESDNILDEALKNIGYSGNNLGERLQSANFKTIDFAWDAHKIRNRIAHEGLNFELTSREARKAFILYETVFKDLKII